MAEDTGSSHRTDKPREKLIGPEAAVEAESKFVEVALQMLFTQTMVGSQRKAFTLEIRVCTQRKAPLLLSPVYFGRPDRLPKTRPSAEDGYGAGRSPL